MNNDIIKSKINNVLANIKSKKLFVKKSNESITATNLDFYLLVIVENGILINQKFSLRDLIEKLLKKNFIDIDIVIKTEYEYKLYKHKNENNKFNKIKNEKNSQNTAYLYNIFINKNIRKLPVSFTSHNNSEKIKPTTKNNNLSFNSKNKQSKLFNSNFSKNDRIIKKDNIKSLLDYPLFNSFLFSNNTNKFSIISNIKIPISFLTDNIINYDFSRKYIKYFNLLNINTIQDLLFTDSEKILNIYGIGRRKIFNLQNQIIKITIEKIENDSLKTEILNHENKEIIDTSSFQNLFTSYIYYCIKKSRDVHILFDRLGISDNKIKVYEEIGKQFGITRERVRQIVNESIRLLKLDENLIILDDFWNDIFSIIETSGGVIKVSDVASKLQNRYNWKVPTKVQMLTQMLCLNNKFKINNDIEMIYVGEYYCLDCSLITSTILNEIQNQTLIISINTACNLINKRCNTECNKYFENKKIVLPDIIIYKVNQLSDKLKIENNYIYEINKWNEIFGDSLTQVIIYSLKCFGKPKHFSEITNYIKNHNIKFKDVNINIVHNQLVSGKQFVLVNRGTYALTEWGKKKYKTHGQAIIDLLKKNKGPLKIGSVIDTLTRKNYKLPNLQSAIYSHPKIVTLKNDYIDLKNRWDNMDYKMNFNEMIKTDELQIQRGKEVFQDLMRMFK